MESNQQIHIYKKDLRSEWQVLLLLIPSIAFALALAFIVTSIHNNKVYAGSTQIEDTITHTP